MSLFSVSASHRCAHHHRIRPNHTIPIDGLSLKHCYILVYDPVQDGPAAEGSIHRPSSGACDRIGEPNTYFLTTFRTYLEAQSLMATLTERSSIGRIVGYSIMCGIGFGSVR